MPSEDTGQRLSRFPGSLLPARSGTSSPHGRRPAAAWSPFTLTALPSGGTGAEPLGGSSNRVRAAKASGGARASAVSFCLSHPLASHHVAVGIEAPATLGQH